MTTLPVFAKNPMTCVVDQAVIHRVGTLQDVETMMNVRLTDNDTDQSNPFTQASTYFRHAKDQPDFSRALRLFKTAAMNGDVEASFIVGFMFSEGYGTSQNACEATYWYCTAGARGIEEAKYALRAQCEHFGLGAVFR